MCRKCIFLFEIYVLCYFININLLKQKEKYEIKKLTPSKMLSSMALATLLVAAAGTQTAQAALTPDFNHNAGNNTQAGGAKHPANSGTPTTADGEIEINGTFTKTVTNLPTPTQDGSYLIVAMPISMSYTYNADSGDLVGSKGAVQNHSVKVDNGSTTNQPIKMRVLGLDYRSHTTDVPVKFVSQYDPKITNQIQVPLQLSLQASGANSVVYSFAELDTTSNNTNLASTEINIPENTNVSVSIEPIPNQQVKNEHLIQKASSTAGHTLKFQFEYAGQ